MFFHGRGFSARVNFTRNKMRKGGQLVTEWHGRAIVIFREKIANRAGEKNLEDNEGDG